MKNENRLHLVLLGLLCLMPALFFWVVNVTPVEIPYRPGELLFGGAPRLELFFCGVLFPLLAMLLGWLALRCNRHSMMAWMVIALGFLETAAGFYGAVFSPFT